MKKRIFSIRTKTLILCVASCLLIGFVLTLLVASLVNHWKERLVQNAITLAEEQGREVRHDLLNIITKQKAEQPEQLQNSPIAHSRIQLFIKQNKNIVMAGFIDDRGTMIIKHYRGELTSHTAFLMPGAQYAAPLTYPGTKPGLRITVKNKSDRLRQVNLPFMLGEKNIGKLTFSVSENAILSRIAYSSRLITRSLIILFITLSVLLLATYFFLWRIFSRHLALVKERDRLDKLAYIGTLASGLAHEIRNPLNAMNINLDVIREEIEDPRQDSPERATELVTNLQREIQQLNQTLSNFMKFALPSKPEKQPLDFVKLLKETLEFFNPEFERTGIIVKFRAPEHCPMKADSTSLKQLIMNLILNAIHAMGKHREKHIELNLFADGKFWQLALTDTGPGFGDIDPEKCFEVFYTTKAGGSGFGLPIARQVAIAHGGKLWAENASPQGGARFHLTLPR